MLKTAVIRSRNYSKHFAGRSHPENARRIEALNDMADGETRSAMKLYEPRAATVDEVALCHDRAYVAALARTAQLDRCDLDPDTHTSRDSYAVAMLAAGGVLTAVEAVIDGAAGNAFALVRPPGHHALPERAMGFCLFNSVAIAARYLIAHRGLKRVMIVDWDVHHGNGTQHIFYESPEVLYVSLHQFPFYPGTGAVNELGRGAGTGYTANVPLPAGCGDAEYLRSFDELIVPLGRRFGPEFVLISAGFDCHYRDPLGSMQVSEAGFVAMARRLKLLAAESCGGRLVAALEGGYDVQALADSSKMVLEELGQEPEDVAAAGGGTKADRLLERARRLLDPVWHLG